MSAEHLDKRYALLARNSAVDALTATAFNRRGGGMVDLHCQLPLLDDDSVRGRYCRMLWQRGRRVRSHWLRSEALAGA